MASCAHSPALAQTTPASERRQESEHDLLSQLDDLKFELGGVFALVTYAGIRDWKWGTAAWRFESEGWFGWDTGSGGQDKLGHAYGTFVTTEFLFLRLRTLHGKRAPVSVYPPLFAWGLQLYVETFDGFSVDHGFAYEDVIMNTLGASAAFVRRALPGVGRVLDYRLEYFPSGSRNGFHPMLDYSGQKFLIALRPGGFGSLDRTSARLIEFYLGYYTRGFRHEDAAETRFRRLYFGFGFDLQGIASLVHRPVEENPGDWFDYASTALSVFQPPYPYPKLSVHQSSMRD